MKKYLVMGIMALLTVLLMFSGAFAATLKYDDGTFSVDSSSIYQNDIPLRKTATATAGSTVTLNASTASTHRLTPTSAETIIVTGGESGQELNLITTSSGTNNYTLTFGSGFKSTGTLSMGSTDAKVFVVGFISDGTNFNEKSRTTAQ